MKLFLFFLSYFLCQASHAHAQASSTEIDIDEFWKAVLTLESKPFICDVRTNGITESGVRTTFKPGELKKFPPSSDYLSNFEIEIEMGDNKRAYFYVRDPRWHPNEPVYSKNDDSVLFNNFTVWDSLRFYIYYRDSRPSRLYAELTRGTGTSLDCSAF